jgi:thiamine-phosphate pyrophosphorylase
MLRYAITDGNRFNRDFHAQKKVLLENARRWADAGIDYVQLREKTMNAEDLLAVTDSIASMFHKQRVRTKLLVNGRADVALAGSADGVHLTATPDELTPAQVRALFQQAGFHPPLISMSSHNLSEFRRARDLNADLIVFGPVFEKRVAGEIVVEGLGLDVLRSACLEAKSIPVFALGGVTDTNASLCSDAGAAGIAGIRLFS